MIGSKPIKDCPFCGNKASVGAAFVNGRWVHGFEASCLSCPANILADTEAEAIELWNSRL